MSSDRLLPWIAGSLLLLAVVVMVATQVPSVECGGEGDVGEGPATALLVVTAVSAVLAAAAALYRVVVMASAQRLGGRDGWILGAALLLLAAAATFGAADGSAAAGLVIGGLVLAGVAFVALTAAALTGKSVDDVGLLLPVYLAAAAWVYLCFGVLVLIATSGIGC
ncbi:MAG TPA: hypothetical protein VFS26_06685 [Solirubrobacterales bacterium]|nr:hypothetical protein [Solirubrobacterales bacterium]